MTHSAAIPLAQISGFLGAGKTTLVNHVLRNTNGKRIVVFVNDFGAINIDYDLIETADANRISLTNGCVCCSLNQDLTQNVLAFCNGQRPDAFIIEASGVADPHALQRSLLPLVQAGHIHLAQQVYVLDAAHIGTYGYEDTEDLIDGAAVSNIVILNKCDLATDLQLDEIVALLARSAPTAELVQTSFCAVHHDVFFHEPTQLPQTACLKTQVSADRFETVSFSDFEPLGDAQLALLLDELHRTCIRAKGTLYVKGAPQRPKILQLVGHRHTLCDAPHDRAFKHAQMVAIGWTGTIDEPRIRSLLYAAPISTPRAASLFRTTAKSRR